MKKTRAPKEFTTAEFSQIRVDEQKLNKIVDMVQTQLGGEVKNADLMNYDFAKKHFPGLVSENEVKFAKSLRSVEFSKQSVDFNEQGGILIDGYTTMIEKVIQEAYDSGTSSYLDNVLPDSNVPARRVVVEVFAAPGGVLDAYQYGQPVNEKNKVGNRSYEFEGAPYRNFLRMDEQDLTFLRALGNPDISARGVLQRLTMYSMQAKVLTANRKALLKNTIFANGTTINGVAINYQIPSYNIVGSVTDPINQWGSYNSTTGAVTINVNSNPIQDLYYYFSAYAPWIARSRLLNKCKLVMNPITQQFIASNPNVRSQILAMQTPKGSAFDPREQYNADFLVKTLIPFFKGEVVVDESAYLLTNSDITWQPDGSGFTNTPVTQNYFVPTGKVLFYIDTAEWGSKLGEFIYTSAVQNGGFQNANPGPWFIIEDCTAPGTRGGPLNPFISLDFGFSGGVALSRPDSTFIGNFVNVT